MFKIETSENRLIFLCAYCSREKKETFKSPCHTDQDLHPMKDNIQYLQKINVSYLARPALSMKNIFPYHVKQSNFVVKKALLLMRFTACMKKEG